MHAARAWPVGPPENTCAWQAWPVGHPEHACSWRALHDCQSLSLPSELLQDLDSCNSDPVAVARCFVDRVRGALEVALSGEQLARWPMA